MPKNVPVSLTPLSTIEMGQLGKHEETVSAGLATFVDVGNALTAIRDGRLYKATHSSFEAYLRERWGMKRAEAYLNIDGAAVVGILSGIPDSPVPTSKDVARPLAKLKDKPAKMAKAWSTAVKSSGGTPTAKDVTAAVEAQLPVKARKPEQLTFTFTEVTRLEDQITARIEAASAEDLIELKRTLKRWAAAINAKGTGKHQARKPAPVRTPRRRKDVEPNFKK